MVMGALAWGGDERNMEPLWEKLPELSDIVQVFYDGFSAPEQLFNQNQVSIASWFSGRTFSMREQGLPVEYIFPEEGAAHIRGAMAVMKNSENVDMAQEFVNANLSPENQRLIAENVSNGPVNAEVDLSSELANRVITEDQLENLYLIDWEYVNERRDQFVEQWGEGIN
jgi:putative spermidine/putrescine transport system substrate-binding protein